MNSGVKDEGEGEGEDVKGDRAYIRQTGVCWREMCRIWRGRAIICWHDLGRKCCWLLTNRSRAIGIHRRLYSSYWGRGRDISSLSTTATTTSIIRLVIRRKWLWWKYVLILWEEWEEEQWK